LWPLSCLRVENGYVQKAVNYAGEMFIIEEIQLYENPVPISALRLSARKVTPDLYVKPQRPIGSRRLIVSMACNHSQVLRSEVISQFKYAVTQ